LVDFVGDAQQIKLLTYRGDRFELRSGKYVARGGRGTARDDGAQRHLLPVFPRATTRTQFVYIEIEALAVQWQHIRVTTKLVAYATVIWIVRLKNNRRRIF